MNIKAFPKMRYGSYTCRNCNSTGYFDVEKMQDCCEYCNNPDFRYNEGIDVDSKAGEALKACAEGRLEDAERLVHECDIANRSSIATMLASVAYYNVRYRNARLQGPESANRYMKIGQTILAGFLNANGLINPLETRFFRVLHNHGDHNALAILLSVYDIASTLSELYSPVTGPNGEKNELPRLMEQRAVLCYKMIDPSLLSAHLSRQIVLRAALDSSDWERARQIVLNSEDCLYGGSFRGEALFAILQGYPSEEGKETLVRRITDSQALQGLDSSCLEEYFRTSQDPLSIQMEIAKESAGSTSFIGSFRLLELLLTRSMEEGRERELLEIICSVRGVKAQSDAVRYILSKDHLSVLNTFLDVLKSTGRRPAFRAETFRSFLLREDLPSSDKCRVLRQIIAFPGSTFLKRDLGRIYLWEAGGALEDRLAVIDTVFTPELPPDPETVEKYLLHCSQDGPAKAQILQKMISIGYRMLSSDSLRMQYLEETEDDIRTQEAVLDVFDQKSSVHHRISRFPFFTRR